jgi:hypothetical protein
MNARDTARIVRVVGFIRHLHFDDDILAETAAVPMLNLS